MNPGYRSTLMKCLLSEAEPFIQAIIREHPDPLPRLIFADCLQEQGLPNSAMWHRLMARSPRYPCHEELREIVERQLATHPRLRS
jgi:uncharacterized protein (TIGR02996 family)